MFAIDVCNSLVCIDVFAIVYYLLVACNAPVTVVPDPLELFIKPKYTGVNTVKL